MRVRVQCDGGQRAGVPGEECAVGGAVLRPGVGVWVRVRRPGARVGSGGGRELTTDRRRGMAQAQGPQEGEVYQENRSRQVVLNISWTSNKSMSKYNLWMLNFRKQLLITWKPNLVTLTRIGVYISELLWSSFNFVILKGFENL